MNPDIVNVNGGAIALGHPIGMSGARLVLTLALELRRRGGGLGAAALCGGGGQGDALIIKVPSASRRMSTGSPRRSRDRAGPHAPGPGTATRARWPDWSRLVENGDECLPEVARGAGTSLRPGPDHRPHRFTGRWQVDDDQRDWCAPTGPRVDASACSPSTRRARSPAAPSSATGSGCRTTPPIPASTSGRCPAAAISAAWPRPPPGRTGARGRRLRRRDHRDRRRRSGRGRGGPPGRHDAGAARARHGRRDPGGQGRHPRGRRRLRGEQGRPRRRRRHAPGHPRA